ncbi:MAG: hypothetical protein KAS16_03000 [Thermoplasmata archaeon]|nr:hypothetical protein [Thermoplasmata archaeon]
MDHDNKKGPKASAQPDLGLSPAYYPGQYHPEPVEYSWKAKLFGILLALGIILFMVWVIYSMVGSMAG